MRRVVVGAALALLLSGGVAMAQPNTLSPMEKAAGWKLLFDGKSTAGWHGYKSPAATFATWR